MVKRCQHLLKGFPFRLLLTIASYCYHSLTEINCGLAKSDHIKRLLLYNDILWIVFQTWNDCFQAVPSDESSTTGGSSTLSLHSAGRRVPTPTPKHHLRLRNNNNNNNNNEMTSSYIATSYLISILYTTFLIWKGVKDGDLIKQIKSFQSFFIISLGESV